MDRMLADNSNDKRTLDTEIVAEAHHRVKNTLQNIISYVNVMFANRDHVSRDELLKLTKYVHSLSLIHDVLLREVQNSGSARQVRIDRIIQDLCEVYALEMDLTLSDFPPCSTTTRRAATISLILNELIDNGKRYGIGKTAVNCQLVGPDMLEISVSNTVDPSRSEIIFGNGLRISSLLAQRDLQSNLVVSADEKSINVRFAVPVDAL